jgi:CheY-like chemotaxis protein
MMGGELQVTSIPNKGSLFWFEIALPEIQNTSDTVHTSQFPVIGYKTSLKATMLLSSKEVNKNFKILVVDNVWDNRIVLTHFLNNLGFTVLEASNGEEALHIAHECLPHIVITDLVMPIMDGLELTRHLRQSFLKNIIIIISSINTVEYYQRQSLEAGCNEFTAKPLSTKNLLNLLQKYLSLGWIYEHSSASLLDATPVVLIGPSPEQASLLFQFATTGNIRKVIEYVTQLEQQNAQLAPFAEKIRQLAKSFKMSKIEEFIKSYTYYL